MSAGLVRAAAGRRPLLAALLAYAAVRAVGLLALVAAEHPGQSVWSLLGGYDGGHYLAIARHGYDPGATRPGGAPTVANPAFFPLFPALLGVAVRVWPGADLTAGLLVAWACGLAAAAALFRLGRRLDGVRSGVVLVVLWAALPHAVVGSMLYSENLFVALAATTLLLLVDGRWLSSAAGAALAGLTRPTASALVATVVVAGLVAVVRRPRQWRPWVAVAVAPLGLLGYVLWVGVRLGRLDGYFWLQDAVWHTHWDGGADTAYWVGRVLTRAVPLSYTATTLVLFVALVLTALLVGEQRIAWSDRWPLVTYSAVLLLVVAGTGGYFHAKGRLLLPDVPALLPVAFALSRASRLVRWVVPVSAALVSAAYGCYLLTVWTSSP